MPKFTFLHNSRCSKSRQALAILKENEIEVNIIEYLKTPLSLSQVKDIYALLDIDSPIEMMRVKESEFTEAGLSKTSSKDTLLQAMADFPKLIERPILFNASNAVIGRPPENVLQIV